MGILVFAIPIDDRCDFTGIGAITLRVDKDRCLKGDKELHGGIDTNEVSVGIHHWSSAIAGLEGYIDLERAVAGEGAFRCEGCAEFAGLGAVTRGHAAMDDPVARA